MRKVLFTILVLFTGMISAQPLAQYDFSELMDAPKMTYLATFYKDKIRFDVKIPERNWTLTAITDDYERKMFIRLLNCKKNLDYRNVVLKDYLDSFDYLWRNPKYHKEHNDYFEVEEGYMEELMDNAMSYHTPKSYLAIWNELEEMEQAEKKEIEMAKQKETDEKMKRHIGETLMVAIMMRMLGGFMSSGSDDGYKTQWDSYNDAQKAVIHEHDNAR